ncbi:hypothetical protein GCM10027614_57950 [Micromonospora vulcania]
MLRAAHNVLHGELIKIRCPRQPRLQHPPKRRVGMPEWTLCADQKVYARLRAVAKPATHRGAMVLR